MKLLTYCLLFAAALSPVLGQPNTTSKEEKAVMLTIQAMQKSWANHNYDDIANWTTPDVDWVNIVGMRWKGREAMRIAHQTYHNGMFKSTPWTLKNVTIRFITPDVAIAHLLSHIGAFYPPDGVDHGGNKRPEADDLATLVLVKQKGKWLLTAGENVVVDQQAAPNNPVRASR
ncbi:MAG: SgcJ/EcaC family oxidoreductase [Cytophagaceae bacterium]|nr:MAG: SgcJ/EcaC family oxidoreductase [Cytophagaceae bacterium]